MYIKQGGGSAVNERSENTLRCRWLVRMCFNFAFCLEVIPMELGLIGVFCTTRNVFLVLIAKVACLTLIFLPLVIYIFLNGLSALKYVRRTVAAVGVIVAVSLAMDFWMVWSMIRG